MFSIRAWLNNSSKPNYIHPTHLYPVSLVKSQSEILEIENLCGLGQLYLT